MRIESTDQWRTLRDLATVSRSIARLFDSDPARARRFTFGVGDLTVDLSKNLVDETVITALVDLAGAAQVDEHLARQAAGERVNLTEDRAVGHMALRAPETSRFLIDGVDVVPEVHRVRRRMAEFTGAVHSGRYRGATGQVITDVVNIGIGGSDLGPAMAYEALRAHRRPGVSCHFVSNVDPADLASVLEQVRPETTLFVVASKTFTTLETLANANAARSWLVDALGPASVSAHFVALSTNSDAVARFGIEPHLMFPFWDWVGGRYSLPSSIGLSLMLAVGAEAFESMLGGMHVVDRHVLSSPTDRNVPLLMALIGVWYRNFLGLPTKAVLPYSHDLRRFPAYLQQLDMESNGKSVSVDGSAVGTQTGPVIWGEPGTNAQHAFLQLLHQGTDVVPCDLIGFAATHEGIDAVSRQDLLFTNLLAQSQALAFGRHQSNVPAGAYREHRVFDGNRPSTVIVGPALTPSTLGQLIALYEHVVHYQGVIWGINSYDQWGVELGKELAGRLNSLLAGSSAGHAVGFENVDSSTAALLDWYREHRGSTDADGGG